MKVLMDIFHGLCMALADSVPGVSGGTIAFILGFYDRFINALDRLMYGNLKEKKEALGYLLKLGVGWLIGIVGAILILTNLFSNHIYEVSSVFIGFILFAIPFIIKEEKTVLKGKYQNLIFLGIGIAIVSLITYFNPINAQEHFIDLTNLNIGLGLYIFFAAMIAISAMVLPGISGSTLLLIFGLYLPVTNAIKELIHLNFSYFPALCIFGFGVLAGIFLVTRLIQIALKKFRSQTIYCILGLMLGSIYAIIEGPVTLEIPKEPLTFQTFSFVYCILGGIIILGLEYIKKRIEEHKEKKSSWQKQM